MQETTNLSSTKRFKVALSFPGERRDYVEEVASILSRELGFEQVLYDTYYTAEFARPDLDIYLQNLYRNESELIAVFLCEDYEEKDWCQLEWRAVKDLIKTRSGEAIMPFRFDMTDIPGLFSTDGYVWIGDQEPEAIAELILQRVGLSRSTKTKKTARSTKASLSPALKIWQDKLKYLCEQEPIAVDPDAKFRLKALIAEAEAKIREHKDGT